MAIGYRGVALLIALFAAAGSLTAQNELFVRAFPTYCHSFDPTGRYIITDSGTYNIETQEKFFLTTDGADLPVFSGSGRFAAFQTAVYDAVTLQALYETRMPVLFFSPDENYAADAGAVYSMASGEMLFAYAGVDAQFSPDSRLFLAAGDAVYDLASGETLYSVVGDNPIFSPNSQYIGTNHEDDGYRYQVLDALSGDVLLTVHPANYFPINFMAFSHDGALVYIPYDHVYEIATGNRVVTFEDTASSGYFSPQDDFLILFNGLYDTTTWERLINVTRYAHPSGTIFMENVTDVYHAPSRSVLFSIDYPIGYLEFSADGRLIVTSNGIYDLEMRQKIMHSDFATISDRLVHFSVSPTSTLLLARILFSGCLVYDYTETAWVQEYGVLLTENDTNIRNAPSTNAYVKASDPTGGIYIITGISADGAWYRILLDDDADSWVAAERVRLLYDTGAIPIVE